MNGTAGRIKQGKGGRATAPLVAQTGGDADPIRAGLKKLYDSVVEEPIPDDFLSLLDRIDAVRATPQTKAAE